MILRLKCPKCQHPFAIEPTSAMHKIELLERDNANLRARLAACEARAENDPIERLKRQFGL